MLHFTHFGKSFDTFQECWNERLSTSDIFHDSFVSKMDNYLEHIEQSESQDSCSGLCDPGLFWFTKSVTLERPETGCLKITVDEDEKEALLTKLTHEKP